MFTQLIASPTRLTSPFTLDAITGGRRTLWHRDATPHPAENFAERRPLASE